MPSYEKLQLRNDYGVYGVSMCTKEESMKIENQNPVIFTERNRFLAIQMNGMSKSIDASCRPE